VIRECKTSLAKVNKARQAFKTVELGTLTYQIVGRQPFAAETNRVFSRNRDADQLLNSTVLKQALLS